MHAAVYLVQKQYAGQNIHTEHGSSHLHCVCLPSLVLNRSRVGGLLVCLHAFIHKLTMFSPYNTIPNYFLHNPKKCSLLIIHTSIFPPIPFPWWVNFSPIACCLSDPDDPGESPNGLLLPIRIDRSTAPCQTRSIHHSFSNEPCSLAASFLPCIALLPFYYYFSQWIDAGKQAHCKPHHN